MKKNKILILTIIFLNNICVVHTQSFEKDWQWLKFTETTASPASSVFENALVDLVTNNLKDTSEVSYYNSITTFIKDIIEDSSITSLDKRNTLDRIITSFYGTFPKKNKLDITIGILESDDCRFSWIQSLCNEVSKHHDYYVFDVIETSKWFSNIEVEEKFEYYMYISTLLYKEDHQQSVDYLLKAINHALESNRDDLNFYHGSKMSEVYHNFYRVASESSDTCDIIKYSLMNISSIKRTYGIQSKEFLNAIMFPIKKGVLEERKARTSFISSSDNEINPQLQQLFQQYDTISDLHERSLLLHNATQICIEQKMDSASFAECVYYAGVHWLEMGELSRGYNTIFQSIHLYSRHCKRFFSSMHDCECIARMANVYYAYGDKISSYILNKTLIDITKDFTEDPNNLKESLIFNEIKLALELSLFEEADSLICHLPEEEQNNKNYFMAIYYYEKGKYGELEENWKKSATYFEKTRNSWVYSDDRNLTKLQNIYSKINDNTKLCKLQNLILEIHKSRLIEKICILREAERVNALEDVPKPTLCVYTREMVSQVMNLNLFRKGIMTEASKVIGNIAMEDFQSRLVFNNFLKACRNQDINKIDSLENALLSSYISPDELYDRLNFDIESIRRNLKKDVLLIDFEFAANQDYLYAFITSHKVKPQILQLCPDSIFENDNISDEDRICAILNNLLPFCKDYNTVLFIPTANISDLPIENHIHKLFPQKKVHRLFNIYSLHKHVEEYDNKSIVLIGNPKFNTPIEPQSTDRGKKWAPLPGTEEEIKCISELWKQSKEDSETKILLKDDATEDNIYALDGKDVNILHFATHGQSNERGDLCSLLMTGANIGLLEMEEKAVATDGVLSSLEIETLYFPRLSLVVLSACDTGIGTYSFEDGVWGLQRAFHIAGAQNLIVSLKKVDDELTQAFMIDFYRNLTKGNSIYKSFWDAMDDADEETRNSFILIE